MLTLSLSMHCAACVGMVYSGFLILKQEIKDWQIEFFWASPFAWIVRSVTINEFDDTKYNEPLPDSSNDAHTCIMYTHTHIIIPLSHVCVNAVSVAI